MDKSKRFFKSYRYILVIGNKVISSKTSYWLKVVGKTKDKKLMTILTTHSLVTNDLFYYMQKFPNKGEFLEINYIVNSNLGRLKEMGVVVFTELCWFEG